MVAQLPVSLSLPVWLSLSFSFDCKPVFLLSVSPAVCLPFCPSYYLSVCLATCLAACLPAYLPAILPPQLADHCSCLPFCPLHAPLLSSVPAIFFESHRVAHKAQLRNACLVKALATGLLTDVISKYLLPLVVSLHSVVCVTHCPLHMLDFPGQLWGQTNCPLFSWHLLWLYYSFKCCQVTFDVVFRCSLFRQWQSACCFKARPGIATPTQPFSSVYLHSYIAAWT